MEEGTMVEGTVEMVEGTSRDREAARTLRSLEGLSRHCTWLLLCLTMVTSLHRMVLESQVLAQNACNYQPTFGRSAGGKGLRFLSSCAVSTMYPCLGT